MRTTGLFIYNFVLALWVGGTAIYTFVITPVIFKCYTRDVAGQIVGKLFPAYFLYNLVLSVLALIIALSLAGAWSKALYKVTLLFIAAAVAGNIYVTFRLHPEVVRVKQEIATFEPAGQDYELRKRFRRLHGVNMVLNLLLLADGTALLLISTLVKK